MVRFFQWRLSQYVLALPACLIMDACQIGCTTPVTWNAGTEDRTLPSIEARIAKVVHAKPPLVRLDMILRNHSSEPLWFLIPAMLPHVSGPSASGVSAVEAYEFRELPSPVIIGQLHGAANAYAVLVPPKGEMKVKNLHIGYRSAKDRADSVELVVRVAKEVLIGTEPIQQWLGVDLAKNSGVELDYCRRRVVSRQNIDGMKEVPLVVAHEVMLIATVPPPYRFPDSTIGTTWPVLPC